MSGGPVVKNLPANAGDLGDMDLITGLGRSSGIENGNPLQYSCLENSMDKDPDAGKELRAGGEGGDRG